METKLIKLLFVLVLIFYCVISSQCQEKSVVNMSGIDICGITFEKSSPEFVKKVLGDPKSCIQKPYNPNIEWGDGHLTLEYDSITFHYLVYDKAFIESVVVMDSRCVIGVPNGEFNISSNLERLKDLFPDSYSYFVNKYQKPYKDNIQKFYVNLLYNTDETRFYGTLTIHMVNDIVSKIFVNFVEGN